MATFPQWAKVSREAASEGPIALVLIAEFRAGFTAGLKMGCPGNLPIKPRKPSSPAQMGSLVFSSVGLG